MASPQAENGHVDIANEIIEALARYNLNGEEYRILLVVLRKTWGFHKKEDAISLSQFEKMTGMKRPNVVRTIKKLVAKQLLGSSQTATRDIVTYWFQKDYEKWEVVAKQLPVVASSITRLVASSLPTKETTTKERNTTRKKIRAPSGDQQFFIAYWKRAYETIEERTCFIDAKSAKHVSDILKAMPLKEAIARAAKFFIMEDDFYKDKKDIGFFRSQLNKIPKANGVDAPLLRDLGLAPPEGIAFEDWKFWEKLDGTQATATGH